ncbi:MAG: hypothetical protein HY566_01885 [Candidatus Kerfeldbacteria bacterium]|nr:hypothetical protein [Candidatus Kerfeldbacteria bacterium]
MDSLSDSPIDGQVTLTASRGKYELTGNLALYNPVLNSAVKVALEAANDVGFDLSRDPDLQAVTVTYTFEILDIRGW